MPTYEVLNKQHVRATVVDEYVQGDQGRTYVLRHAGKPLVYAVGARIPDLTWAELEAFPDRFLLVEGEPLTPPPEPPPDAPPPALLRLNPEIFPLMSRACTGQATQDEQLVVDALVTYLAQQAAGQATPAAAAALDAQLREFGLTLFVEGA